jgi:dipeptidyl-peptidase-3
MQPVVPPHDDRPILLETVGEFAVVPLRIDGFEELSPRERGLAFYLYRAALAGRDIHYDQMGRQNLEVRDLLEEVLVHSEEIPRAVMDPLHRYLKLFWVNNGNHNDRTKRKFVPRLSFEELRAAVNHAINNGATIRLALGESIDQKLARLRRTIFDPGYEPLLTCKNPPQGQDILSCSSVNYYDGLSLADLEGFTETHPLNSRLVKRGGRIAEEIYRAGRGDLPHGRYAMELQTIIGFLAKARAFADRSQREVLEHLEDYFATGEPETFRRYNIAWVQHDSPLDTINGFIETYKDPRSVKGAWEGIVYFVDRRATDLHKRLASEAQYFEDHAPWEERFKRRGFTLPLANAISVLVAVGDAGPMPPIGINLPNEEAIGERYGNKSFHRHA